MSAAKKIIIPYLEEKNGFLLTAKDNRTAKVMERHGFKMRFREGMYTLKVEKLPKLSDVRFKKHSLKIPSLEKRKELENEYARYKKMEEAIDMMVERMDELWDNLKSMVDKIGLRLKPSLPKDAQIYVRGKGVRLHNCVSVTKIYDEEAILKSSKKYSVLERCFDLKKIVLDFKDITESERKVLENIAKRQEIEFSSKFDEAIFEDIKGSLPPSVVNKMIKLDSYVNFRETELPNPECIHCGGYLRKDNTCKRCNRSQELE